jgi:hypothetical protein
MLLAVAVVPLYLQRGRTPEGMVGIGDELKVGNGKVPFTPPHLYAHPQDVVKHTTLHNVVKEPRAPDRTGAMQDAASELLRILLLRRS